MATRSNSPYVPTFIKAVRNDTKPIVQTYSDADMANTNIGGTNSFKYDHLDFPLKSTQQLNVDWSKFENHTFFSLAEVKVNEAFNKIINSYPFDGTKKEIETFLDSLTGFEKYVFDAFPEWSGALHFSGTQVGENPSNGFGSNLGTWIAVKDKTGALYPGLSKNNQGISVINPPDENTPFTVETLIHVPTISNDTQVVFQKTSSPKEGISFHLESTGATDKVRAVFSVSSQLSSNNVSAYLKKGGYNHICLTLNRDGREDVLQFFVNETLVSESKSRVEFKKLEIDETDFLIGSGTSFYSNGTLVTPTQTFSGTLDEFRIFHSVRDQKLQKLYASKGLYASPDLKLYYRFNEPAGVLSQNSTSNAIVLDSSGNSLHAAINNFTSSLRTNASLDPNNVVVNEKDIFKKVLFPAYEDVLSLNQDLLVSATKYDRENPNSIIKLIPKHYLLEGALQDGFETVEGNAGDPYSGDGIPGQGQKGSAQLILTFLYIWSKFFDEIKLFIDAFSTLKTVDYDTIDTIPDNFLEDLVRGYGFYLPKFFNHATIEQFAEGENIEGLTNIDTPLKKIQAIILRRVLVGMPSVIRSKGTQHSIKSFLRSVGIDPENSIKIREYGGSTVKQLKSSREKRKESLGMINFTTSSFLISQPLSASRIEPGFPNPAGSFYKSSVTGRNAGTTNKSDGLLTSGSWTIEGVFKIPPQKTKDIVDIDGNQSLFRIICTGSTGPNHQPSLIANVVATQGTTYPFSYPTIQAFIRPASGSYSPILHMSMNLSGGGIFDGDKWNVSFGCFRNDQINSEKSSSYFLRAGKTEDGEIVSLYTTSSYFYEISGTQPNVLKNVNNGYNASGSYICMGPNQTIPEGASYSFLNDTMSVDDIARTVDYVGWASNVRFWSKGISIEEWKEHVRNPKSAGVSDPKKNYNFTSNVPGSFEKLRLDSLQKQSTRTADADGRIQLLDFSLNNIYFTGIGFSSGSKIVIGDYFDYSYLSPVFDESSTDDKIRIRSFSNSALLEENLQAVPTPSYLYNDLLLQEPIQDDLRLSIEFSMVDSLDKDIVSMFSNFDPLNDALGRPEIMFSSDYPDLEVLRDVYFNRLSSKPDFRKFLEFYRWFDASISTFIEQLIPGKTRYKGTNFVVESHVLERHKHTYKHGDNYVGRPEVVVDPGIRVQQIVGKIGKY